MAVSWWVTTTATAVTASVNDGANAPRSRQRLVFGRALHRVACLGRTG